MEPTFDNLAARVGQPFSFATTGREVTLTLVEATPHDNHPGGSLMFTGASGSALDQATYEITSADVSGALFVVPIADDGTTRTYQAVFA